MTSKAAGSYARWWKQGHEQSCSYAHWLRQWLKPSVFAHFRKAAPEQKGFLLMEYVFSLAAGAVLARMAFSQNGAPAASGYYRLRHRELAGFAYQVDVQPVTGRVLAYEGQ